MLGRNPGPCEPEPQSNFQSSSSARQSSWIALRVTVTATVTQGHSACGSSRFNSPLGFGGAWSPVRLRPGLLPLTRTRKPAQPPHAAAARKFAGRPKSELPQCASRGRRGTLLCTAAHIALRSGLPVGRCWICWHSRSRRAFEATPRLLIKPAGCALGGGPTASRRARLGSR